MAATIIIAALIAAAFIAALRNIFRNHKSGGCSCGCEGCSCKCSKRDIRRQ